MAVLPIRIMGDPVLHAPAAPVEEITDEVRTLVSDMFETMDAAPGVGLAAPQVGVGAQVFAVDVTQHPKTATSHGTFVLCNARVV